jgi:hypothetical protein
MVRSALSCSIFALALALGNIVPVGTWADESYGDNLTMPVSAASSSITTMQAEIDDLRRRLDAIDWAQQPAYDQGVYYSLVPAWVVSVDYLNWDLRQRSTDFAITTDDGALAVGVGSVHRLELDRNSGVRGRLAYRTHVGWELGLIYTYFWTDGAASAEEPAGGNMWATRSHPARYEEAATADASSTFSFHVMDLEARYPIIQYAHVDVHLFGGVRWAELEQDFLVRYDGRDFDRGLFRDRTKVNGFGLRMGAETHWWWNSSWGAFGSASGSLLYGRFRTHLFEADGSCEPCEDILVDVHDAYGQPVPVFDAALGIAWNHGPLQLRGGYEMASWFNFADRSMFPDETHEGAYSPKSTDVLLDGFFFRLSYTY